MLLAAEILDSLNIWNLIDVFQLFPWVLNLRQDWRRVILEALIISKLGLQLDGTSWRLIAKLLEVQHRFLQLLAIDPPEKPVI